MTRVLLVASIVWLALVAAASAQTQAAGADRVYGSAEYLLWWLKDSPAPVPVLSTGRLDTPGTRVLLGGEDIDTGEHHGGRFTLGYWLTRDQAWGLEARYFFLPESTVSKTVESSGAPDSQVLRAPFLCIDACTTPGGEAGLFVASPGSFAGSMRQSLTSSLKGGELSVSRRVAAGPAFRLDLLGGFRYFGLKEKYKLFVDSPLVPPVEGDVYQYGDVFDARNDFYGGQLGVRGEYRRGSWFANGTAKVGLGVMRQSVDVNGSFVTSEFNPVLTPDQQTLLGFGAVQQFPGGIYALPTNMGSHKRDVFAVIPELTLNVGYDLTSWASVFLGYTFLYANDVVRPANQIDRRINPSGSSVLLNSPEATLQGTAAPAFRFRSSDFWAQGLTVGVAFRY
jgi:hypothetical protein